MLKEKVQHGTQKKVRFHPQTVAGLRVRSGPSVKVTSESTLLKLVLFSSYTSTWYFVFIGREENVKHAAQDHTLTLLKDGVVKFTHRVH